LSKILGLDLSNSVLMSSNCENSHISKNPGLFESSVDSLFEKLLSTILSNVSESTSSTVSSILASDKLPAFVTNALASEKKAPRDPKNAEEEIDLDLETSLNLLRSLAPSYMKFADSQFDFSSTTVEKEKGGDDFKQWSNPLLSPLPQVSEGSRPPSIYCLYGVGRQTERGYVYSSNDPIKYTLPIKPSDRRLLANTGNTNEKLSSNELKRLEKLLHELALISDHSEWRSSSSSSSELFHLFNVSRSPRRSLEFPSPFLSIDHSQSSPADASESASLSDSPFISGFEIQKGVKLSDGDGTVPTNSLGYMCTVRFSFS